MTSHDEINKMIETKVDEFYEDYLRHVKDELNFGLFDNPIISISLSGPDMTEEMLKRADPNYNELKESVYKKVAERIYSVCLENIEDMKNMKVDDFKWF